MSKFYVRSIFFAAALFVMVALGSSLSGSVIHYPSAIAVLGAPVPVPPPSAVAVLGAPVPVPPPASVAVLGAPVPVPPPAFSAA